MICFPRAKINIGLNVTSKRSDGYHNIETIFYPIGLSDILELIPDPGLAPGTLNLTMSGIPVEGASGTNLVSQAYKIIRAFHPLPGISVHLHKQIPTGAGLGGGSSDGAFMLSALNDLFKLRIPAVRLASMALELGSDCPFFLDPVPSLATGRGEVLKPLNLSLKGLWLYVFQPVGGISTASAYRSVTVREPEINLSGLISLPPHKWRGNIRNAFQDHAVSEIPAIGEILDFLESKKAIYSSLTGSGSAVYGFFKDEISIPADFADYLIWKELLS